MIKSIAVLVGVMKFSICYPLAILLSSQTIRLATLFAIALIGSTWFPVLAMISIVTLILIDLHSE